MLTNEDREHFERFLRRNGLKLTQQREAILNAFFQHKGEHISVETLHAELRPRVPGLGTVTVYRTMRLLEEAGLAKQRHFGTGMALYEPHRPAEHHDHLICTQCGRIIEFEQCDIERLQEEVARANNFTIKTHRLEIYGLCESCAKPSAK